MDRRAFFTGAVALLAAPAIVRAASLMPVRAWRGPESYLLDMESCSLHDLRFPHQAAFITYVRRIRDGKIFDLDNCSFAPGDSLVINPSRWSAYHEPMEFGIRPREGGGYEAGVEHA